MANDWALMLGIAADNDYRIDLAIGRLLVKQIAYDLNEDLEWAANMVLQHYRHPANVTVETLTVA